MKATTKDRHAENKNRLLALKESFLDAFEVSGGTDSLAEWAKKNPDKFYPVMVRILLKETQPFKIPTGFMHMS